ncbi:MAG: hypothetical protein ACYC2K_17375, partial [Gemmatimonadales bacterium]
MMLRNQPSTGHGARRPLDEHRHDLASEHGAQAADDLEDRSINAFALRAAANVRVHGRCSAAISRSATNISARAPSGF